MRCAVLAGQLLHRQAHAGVCVNAFHGFTACLAIVLDYSKQTIGRPRVKLLLWLATELCEPRLCFALEDSSLSGVCDIEIYE